MKFKLPRNSEHRDDMTTEEKERLPIEREVKETRTEVVSILALRQQLQRLQAARISVGEQIADLEQQIVDASDIL